MRTKNKFIIAAVAALIATGAFAQSSKVTSAWNYQRYKELDKAQKSIDDAAKHESTMNEAKTWHYRGKIYSDIAKSTEPEYKNLSPDPLWEAAISFQKVLELDIKKKGFCARSFGIY